MFRSIRRASLSLFLLSLPSICQADLVPRLVRDIDPASYAGSSSPRQLSELRHGMAFTVRGRELWVYDDQNDVFTRVLQRAEVRQLRGNLYAAREASGDWTFWYAQGFPYFNAVPATTERVSRLGVVYPDPQGIGPVVFEAAKKGSALSLWIFGPDGPAEIARPLPLEDGRLLRDWTPMVPKSYFIARHRTLGTALWATDGTRAGTAPVVAPSPGRTIPLLLAGELRGRLLLAISGGEPELWWSDGTSRGLRPFFEIVRGRGAATVTEARVVAGRAFLVIADGRRGRQLWTSDGTAAGTRPLTHFARDPLRAIGLPLLHEAGLWYFTADDGVHGRELWQTDGTPQGTRLVADVCPGACSSDPRDLSYQHFLDSPPGLVFTAAGPNGRRALWRSDGTQEGTLRLTPPGVVAATGLQLGQFFAAADATFGEELWITDGSPETTRLWQDLEREANGGSNPVPLGTAGDRLIFWTYGTAEGSRLWSSDGTAAGTFRIPAPRGPRMGISDVPYGTSLGDLFVFVGSPRGSSSSSWALWSTDGTTAPIARLTPPGVVVQSIPYTAGHRVLFFATDPAHGTELWASEGTPATTGLVADLAPGPGSVDVDLNTLSLLRGQLLFRRLDDSYHYWISDGTAAGTRRLVDADPLLAPLDLYGGLPTLAEIPGKLFFLGTPPGSGDVELWVSDGTAAAPLAFAGDEGRVGDLFAAGTRLFFAVLTDTAHLWITDGTPAGTFLVPTPQLDLSLTPVPFGDRLLFADRGTHFWVTDGTAAGTFPLLDPEGQEIDATLFRATAFGRYLVFASGNGAGSCYVWDGTGPTVDRIDEVACASRFQQAGNRLFFAGFEPGTGTELWVLEER